MRTSYQDGTPGASLAGDVPSRPDETRRPGIARALWRGWRRRCPRCAHDDLFATYFRLREACPRCGLVTRREAGAWTGQMYLSAAVTQVVAAVLMVAAFLLTDWPLLVSLSVLLPVVVGFCYWTLPRFMATWAAIEYLTDRANREEWT